MLQNATVKEKVLMFVLVFVFLGFIIYMFVYSPMKDKQDALRLELADWQAQEAYFDALKESNDASTSQLQNLNNDIGGIEDSFLPILNNDSIENFLKRKFLDNGCKYLSSFDCTPITCEQVLLPDGSLSDDRLLCNRVEVVYAATDGYCVEQYNDEPLVSMYDNIDYAFFQASVKEMGLDEKHVYNDGYEGFIKTLQELENLDSDCIKIHSIKLFSEEGFNTLTAEIDFYAINSVNRVSSGDMSPEYVTWAGSKDIPTGHGVLGIPLIVKDVENSFYNVMLMTDLGDGKDRPFATYYSVGFYHDFVENYGLFVPDPEANAQDYVNQGKDIPLVPYSATVDGDIVSFGADTSVPENTEAQ